MIHALRAFGSGLRTVLLAPLLLIVITTVTAASAIPFGLILDSQLRTALANRQPVYLGTAEIDAEWWMEFRAHAEGLAATFTPAIIGFAAPLGNVSATLDGSTRPLVLAGPVVLSLLVWSWLWGGLFARFAAGRRIGPRAFWAAAWLHARPFAVISLVAAVVQLVLYFTVHAVLFGPVYGWLATAAGSERAAFAWRVLLYAIFAMCLAVVSLMADYARISAVVTGRRGVREAMVAAAGFLRRHGTSALVLYLLAGLLFVALLVMYGVAEVYGGTRLGGWRSILIGQGYIVARLAIRLTLAAGGVRLFLRLQRPASPGVS